MLRSLVFAWLLFASLLCAVTVFAATDNLTDNSTTTFQATALHIKSKNATGTVITVTTTVDELNIDGDCSLREAIQAAYLDAVEDACPAGTGGDSIYIPAANYQLTLGQLNLTGTVTLQGSMTDTTALDGGGLYRVLFIHQGATATLIRLEIKNGAIPQFCHNPDDPLDICSGGGVINFGTTLIVESTIANNQAGTDSSQVYAAYGASGGGIFNAGILTITNSTVSGNAAGNGFSTGNHHGDTYCSPGGEGGGLANFGMLTLDNSTVADNRPGTGGPKDDSTCDRPDGSGLAGGLYNADSATASLKNSIVTDNVNSDCGGTVTSLGFNVIQTYEGCSINGDVIYWDAYLEPLADNGGPTPTHALNAHSPAIDAGDCTDSTGITITVDQRNMPRPQGNACDIGAYESPYTGTFRLRDTSLPLIAYQPAPCTVIIPACNLTNQPTFRDESPSWSPDGQKIVFGRNEWDDGEPHDVGIFVMNADGSNPVQLTEYGRQPTWSPDGTKIAFINPYDRYLEIYVMDADGTHQTRLTSDHSYRWESPMWSPNGKLLLYQLDEGYGTSLYVMHDDGSHKIRLVTDASLGQSPWSPDGSKIVFSDLPTSRIGIINVDGSNRVFFGTGAQDNLAPSWSPDGSKIALICESENARDICVVGSDGTGVTKLTNYESKYVTAPSWSPNGSKLLFAASPTPIVQYELILMNSDGSQRTQLTNASGGISPNDAVWSPDSRKIAFVRGESGVNLDIYLLGIGNE